MRVGHIKLILGGLFWLTIMASDTLASQKLAPALTPEALDRLLFYLNIDCGHGEKHDPLEDLRHFQSQVEPVLLKLVREGPDQISLLEFQRTANQQWERLDAYRKARLESSTRKKPTNTLLRETYVADRINSIVHRYQERSTLALASWGSEKARQELDQIREQANADLHLTIDRALSRAKDIARTTK